MPLVLDLDDTLVRAVGPNPQRYVPVEAIHLGIKEGWNGSEKWK